MTDERTKSDCREQATSVNERELILYNDDFNTFEFVIETLVEVCGHELLQAEQCALIAHHNGKCSVMSGPVDELKEICTSLCDRGLSADIQ